MAGTAWNLVTIGSGADLPDVSTATRVTLEFLDGGNEFKGLSGYQQHVL